MTDEYKARLRRRYEDEGTGTLIRELRSSVLNGDEADVIEEILNERLPIPTAHPKRDVPCAECNATYGHWDHCTKSAVSDEDRELARQKRQLAPVSWWRPMDTAPKGTAILVCRYGGPIPVIARWSPRAAEYVGIDDRMLTWQPTHWMPLPEVPR